MYSRNLFVLDFVRRFFVEVCTRKSSEAYTVCTLMKFVCDWQKISHKSKCRKAPRVHFIQEEEKIYERFYYRNSGRDRRLPDFL